MMQSNNIYPSFRIERIGSLTISEVYDYYDGPKIFSARNAVNSYYFVFWADEKDEINTWIYVPTSINRLRKIKLGAISLRDAIVKSETELVYLVKQTEGFEFVSIEEKDCNSIAEEVLPLEDDYLEYEQEIEYDDEKSKQNDLSCYLRLRFSKSGKKHIYLNNVTKVLEAFRGYLFPLLKTYGHKDMLIPLSAQSGSFILNIGLKDGEAIAEILRFIVDIINDDNIERIEKYLRDNKIDPDGIYRLINSINENGINLEVLTSYDENKDYETITSIEFKSINKIRDSLEIISKRTLSSIEVPQADEIDRIYKLLSLSLQNIKINEASLGVVQRQVSYYKQAARILNFYDSENRLTNLGFKVLHVDEDERKNLTRIQFETSKCGWAWLKWCDAKSIFDVDPDSAQKFLLASSPSLSASTARRRSQTLRSWHKSLTEGGN